ncbi:MAG: PAS domain S-box protein [Thermoplasmatota archaeon]
MHEKDILIVEDERLVAEDIKQTLEDIGYTVVDIVNSGEEAIERSRELEPGLVLMDIVLKGEMDGIEAADKIKSELGIPLIYITAYADDKRLERAKVTEPFGYILKPYRKRELHSNIQMAFYKHEMERKLVESEKKYRGIFENTGTAMAMMEEDNTFYIVNEEFEQLTGYSKERLENNMALDKFFSPSDLDKILKLRENIKTDSENNFNNLDVNFVNRFGEIRDMIIQLGVIPEIKKSVISLIDITEQRKRYENLIESQEAFRGLFDRSYDAVNLINKKGEFIDVNENFCQLLGYHDFEILDTDCRDLLLDKDEEKFDQIINLIFEGKIKEKNLDLKAVTKDGDEIILNGRFSLVTGMKSEPLYIIWNIDTSEM